MAEEHELDATGLKCPLPVLKARKLVKRLGAGDTLSVTATDPGAPKDFEAFCEAQGCTMLESTEGEGVFRITLRKD